MGVKQKEKKWKRYIGTGITAKLKNGKYLALRQSISSKRKYGIILKVDSDSIDTPIKVLKEFEAKDIGEASLYFQKFIKEKKAKLLPTRKNHMGIGAIITCY